MGDDMTAGERIKEIRLAMNMTQKQLGECVGIAEPTIRRYELGKLNPKLSTLEKIADSISISVDFFTSRPPFNDLKFLEDFKSVIIFNLIKNNFFEKGENFCVGEVNNYDYWKCISDNVVSISLSENSTIKIIYKDSKEAEMVKYQTYTLKLDFASSIQELAKDNQQGIAFRILKDLCLLNKESRIIALERVQELTKIPEYQKDKNN